MDTLPTPNDERVRLVHVPGERVAVLRYSGAYNPSVTASRTEELLKLCGTTRLKPRVSR